MNRSLINKLVLLTVLISVSLLSACDYISITPTEISPPDPSPIETVPPSPINPTWTPPVTAVNQTAPLPGIADVVAAVKPGVVSINTETVTIDFFNRPLTQKGAGSGWIIDSSGIIVTNNHVIEDAKTIIVTMDDGSTYNVDVNNIYTDPLNDLAILRVNTQGLPALKVGDSTRLRIGDWVVAIGNSLGLGISAKQGIISRKGVSVPVDQGQTLYDLLETSAAINPGNSGGPLVNLSGQVIGITSAKISNIGVEGMGYAISTETAMPIVQQLIKNGYVIRPWLGVNLRSVDQFVAQQYRLALKKGVLVTQVAADSPAARGGLQAGDVIVSAAGKDMNTADDLVRVIRGAQIGLPLDIAYYRGDTRRTTQVTPVQAPR